MSEFIETHPSLTTFVKPILTKIPLAAKKLAGIRTEKEIEDIIETTLKQQLLTTNLENIEQHLEAKEINGIPEDYTITKLLACLYDEAMRLDALTTRIKRETKAFMRKILHSYNLYYNPPKILEEVEKIVTFINEYHKDANIASILIETIKKPLTPNQGQQREEEEENDEVQEIGLFADTFAKEKPNNQRNIQREIETLRKGETHTFSSMKKSETIKSFLEALQSLVDAELKKSTTIT